MDKRAKLREIAAGIYAEINKKARTFIELNDFKFTQNQLKATVENCEITFLSDGTQKIVDTNRRLELMINFKGALMRLGYISDICDINSYVGFTPHEKNSAMLGDDEAIPEFEGKMEDIFKAVQGKLNFEQLPPPTQTLQTEAFRK